MPQSVFGVDTFTSFRTCYLVMRGPKPGSYNIDQLQRRRETQERIFSVLVHYDKVTRTVRHNQLTVTEVARLVCMSKSTVLGHLRNMKDRGVHQMPDKLWTASARAHDIDKGSALERHIQETRNMKTLEKSLALWSK